MDAIIAEKTELTRVNAVKECYDAADPEKTNALTMKPLVEKLSGFAKFELNHKLSKEQFTDIIMRIIGTGENFN